MSEQLYHLSISILCYVGGILTALVAALIYKVSNAEDQRSDLNKIWDRLDEIAGQIVESEERVRVDAGLADAGLLGGIADFREEIESLKESLETAWESIEELKGADTSAGELVPPAPDGSLATVFRNQGSTAEFVVAAEACCDTCCGECEDKPAARIVLDSDAELTKLSEIAKPATTYQYKPWDSPASSTPVAKIKDVYEHCKANSYPLKPPSELLKDGEKFEIY